MQVEWVNNKETKGSSDFWTEWLSLVGPTERWREERTNAKKLQLHLVGWQSVVGRVLLLCTGRGSKWVGNLELALPQELLRAEKADQVHSIGAIKIIHQQHKAFFKKQI